MSFLIQGASALDEEPCRYGESRLPCRGPRREPDGHYIVFMGGSETYGRFVEWPFAALTEQATGRVCINLGSVNAGLDSYVHDRSLMDIAKGADAVVVQIMPAQNLSNRFYRVHPRRNDRFLEPTPELVSMYPEVDFTEFNFNMHLLNTLKKVSPSRFGTIKAELKSLWTARMRRLIEVTGKRTLLLWLRYMDRGPMQVETAACTSPAFVDAKMIDSLRSNVAGIIMRKVRSAGATGDLESMFFGQMEEPIAEQMIGPTKHALIANAVVEALRDLKK